MIRAIDEHHLQVGERTWWGDWTSESARQQPGIELLDASLGYEFAFERRQFIVRFESKWWVSILWGSMSYSDNHDHGFGRPPYDEFVEEPNEVEAAVFHADRDGTQGNDGDPFAYINAEQLNALLYHVSKLHTEDHFNSDRTDDVLPRRPHSLGANEGD